jgi:hypothetical protein
VAEQTDIQTVAAELRDAFTASSGDGQAALVARYGPTIDVRHVPAMEQDGPVDRDWLVKMGGLESKVYKVAAPDLQSETTVEVVDATTVHIDRRTRGVVGGEPVDYGMRMVLTVESGEVTGLTTHIGPDMTAAMALIFAAPAAAEALQELMAAAAPSEQAPTATH